MYTDAISARNVYPPKGDKGLHDLHKHIIDAPIALHFKHCLLFYLLKDLSSNAHEQPEIAEDFARSVYLASRYWTFVEGLWALDHLQCQTAVGHLTHPSIIPTFPDEILLVLLNHVATAQDPSVHVLPLAYYNCANPPLESEEVKIEYTKYLARRTVTETFYWIRERAEYEQHQLLGALIKETLQGSISRSDEPTLSKEERATELISLPFTDEEEQWIEKFLTEGDGRNLPHAADTVLMRRIATGRLYTAAGDLPVKGRKHDHVNWEILKDGVKNGLGPRTADGF